MNIKIEVLALIRPPLRIFMRFFAHLQLLCARLGSILIRGDIKTQRITRRNLVFATIFFVAFEFAVLCLDSFLPFSFLRIAYSTSVHYITIGALLFSLSLLWNVGNAIVWTHDPFKNQVAVHENPLRQKRNLRGMVEEIKSNLPVLKAAGYDSLIVSTHLLGDFNEDHMNRLARAVCGTQERIFVYKKQSWLISFSHFLLTVDRIKVRSKSDGVILIDLRRSI
jgi:hypothetical protein